MCISANWIMGFMATSVIHDTAMLYISANGTVTYPYTCNSCNTGMGALPDMYADAREYAAPESKCRHIRQCTSAFVATNMLHFQHSKNQPEVAIHCSAYL